MVAAGFFRKCIPAPAGGENAGLIDMAIIAEEFYSVNANVTLTMLGTVLGLLPISLGGTPEQWGRLLGPFLKKSGAPLAGFAPASQAAAPTPLLRRRARASAPWPSFRTTAGSSTAERSGFPPRPGGIVRARTSYASCAPGAPPEKAMSIIAVECPASGIVFERAIDSVGHRAHLTPQFGFENVSVPRHNLLGEEGNGLALTAASVTGTAALVGIFGVALMRAAFDFALHFARTERRGGVHPIIEHQAVGYALADAKMMIESARYLSWRACHAVDTQSLAADELAIHAKIYGSETAIRVNAATKSLAIECARDGVRVNAVSPGIIKTPMHPLEAHQVLSSLHPMGRMGEVSDIVDAGMYLDSAGFVTGEILHVDGGQAAGHHTI
jgi:alkylation response protein AidB-like acyl-CoA dehydrogenase